jgi:glucose-1-phosphate cytidylyltransferase
MKVVLFCGGLGTRLREYSETIPKPLVPIGDRPIIWHLMKYYAHYGHKEFILCLGFKGDTLKDYFLNYNPNVSRDFTIEPGGVIRPCDSDISDWRITFVDTGHESNIGQRLLRVKPYVEDDDMFLANYSDQLSDLALPQYLDAFRSSNAIGTFVAVKSSQSFHTVSVEADGHVSAIRSVNDSDLWINGGYFAFRRTLFDFINEGEELVEEPFSRLIAAGKLRAHRHTGFWRAMDTLKDKIGLDAMYESGKRPWQVWNGKHSKTAPTASARHAPNH